MTIEQTAKAFAAGKPAHCHNAHTDGSTYRLHGHPIAVKNGEDVVFYWHRYYTKTTAAHMNEILRALHAEFRVSYAQARDSGQDYFVWRSDALARP